MRARLRRASLWNRWRKATFAFSSGRRCLACQDGWGVVYTRHSPWWYTVLRLMICNLAVDDIHAFAWFACARDASYYRIRLRRYKKALQLSRALIIIVCCNQANGYYIQPCDWWYAKHYFWWYACFAYASYGTKATRKNPAVLFLQRGFITYLNCF